MAVRLTMVVDTIRELEEAVNGLGRVCQAQLSEPGCKLPALYSGRIRYQREAPGQERWQSAAETAQKGHGDCEDLAAYRLGELWRDGETKARARVVAITPTLRHVMVARGDGTLEDPSKRLGMAGKG
jgi:hypothetical protein